MTGGEQQDQRREQQSYQGAGADSGQQTAGNQCRKRALNHRRPHTGSVRLSSMLTRRSNM